MLRSLRLSKFITETNVRPGETANESAHRLEFTRYLREIPDNFIQIARSHDKRHLVLEHLKTFYMRLPKEKEVDIVLERVTNLASLVELGREAVQSKAMQFSFKRANWEKIGRCALCGYKFPGVEGATVDHIIPISLGGPDRKENWQLTCTLCNSQKQDYWGVSDLSRLSALRACQSENNFFRLPQPSVLDSLKLPNNPTRYWVLERDQCKCSEAECGVSSKETELYVAPREKGFLLTIDNLATYCTDCVRRRKTHYCSYP